MDRELKRGTLEMVILALLAGGDRYGYEIVTELAVRTDGRFELREGTLYPVLYRLEAAGLVEPYWQTQERGVPRKYYRMTRAGRASLAEQVGDWRSFVSAIDHVIGGSHDG
ncbi:MAG TPA: PadR family transcriptional regulator [Longimicrobiales bacterium]|nr:PadR family transcriptional regulator [Longimicrobiales bacterium]